MSETFMLTYFHTNNPKKVYYQLFFLFLCFFILQVLLSHQFYTHQCIHVNPNCPIQHTTIKFCFCALWFKPLHKMAASKTQDLIYHYSQHIINSVLTGLFRAHMLPENWNCLFVGVHPNDSTKPKSGRRKDFNTCNK